LGAGAGAGLTRWQAAALAAVAGWVWAASFYDLTCRTRALAQPWVTRRVHTKILSLKFLRHPTGMISLPLPAPHLHQCESLDSSSIILAIGRSVKNYQFHPWFLNLLIDLFRV